MPGIRISHQLRSKLPPEQQTDHLEQDLLTASGGACALCGEPMNPSSDDLEADHRDPEAHEGLTTIENLDLVHAGCNRAKRATPNIRISPFLRFQAFLKKHPSGVRYGDLTPYFKIKPKPIQLVASGAALTASLPDGTSTTTPVFTETVSGKPVQYCFVEVPQEALFNDDECQPRHIKPAQVWAIYCDLQINPLHEPPGCRVAPAAKGMTKLLMFDGQHKTAASWLAGRTTIVVKIYLDLDLQATTRLVNSVQAKIKKLPLSPFEVAAKLGDEWKHRLDEYELQFGPDVSSEHGFINDFLSPGEERKRGKQAFQEALLDRLLSNEELVLLKYVKRSGQKEKTGATITEAALKNKLLKTLVDQSPMTEPGQEGRDRRRNEGENIVRVLNLVANRVFNPNGGSDPLGPDQEELVKRFSYQSAMSYVARLVRNIVSVRCHRTDEDAFLGGEISEPQVEQIEKDIDRLFSHPIWTKPFEAGPRAIDVREALAKNQAAESAFKKVQLTIGYVLGYETIPTNWFA